MMEFWFWTIFSGLTLLWYIIVTGVVTYKGGGNIREMIKRLSQK